MPPIRFKERGLLGVVVGAIAQKPALFLVLVAMLGAWDWLSAILAAWLFLGSLVGLLGHQILDARNDHSAGVRTFVTGAGVRLSLRLCGACAAGVGLTVLAPFAFTSFEQAWPVAAALAALSSVYAFKGLRALCRAKAEGTGL
jgi:4-hydroxybenzoate polyprenyltransferase